jgi:hypothetical protein
MKMKDVHHPLPNGRRYRGLGDVIAAGTRATGIDKVAKFVAKAVGEEDCGCGERQDTLNKRFPFKDRKK